MVQWELAQLPPGRWVIGSQWSSTQAEADGSVDKYKGRIVAQGFSRSAVSLQRSFASTARNGGDAHCDCNCGRRGLELHLVDVSTAFLNGEIDAEVYMKIPDGLSVEGILPPGRTLNNGWSACSRASMVLNRARVFGL